MMASKLSDDLAHPCSVISTLAGHDAVVPHLNALAVTDDYLAGVRHLRDRVRIARRHGQLDAAPNAFG